MKRLAILFLIAAFPAAAQGINTTELDDAMTRCRQHIVPDPKAGQYVFAAGWEDCNVINRMWQATRGVASPSPEADKAMIGEVLRKRLQ